MAPGLFLSPQEGCIYLLKEGNSDRNIHEKQCQCVAGPYIGNHLPKTATTKTQRL